MFLKFYNFKNYFALLLIVIIGLIFRTTNLNWDSSQHLHPDERFLTMVNNDTKMVKNLQNYLDQNSSSLNPRNANYNFFVYGNLTLLINKIVAQLTAMDNYDGLTLQGRFLSAIWDTISIVIVFLIAEKLNNSNRWSRQIALWSSLVYALSVSLIQQSHFFTSDTLSQLLHHLTTLSCIIYYQAREKQLKYQTFLLIINSFFAGLLMATKLSGIYSLILSFIVILVSICKFNKQSKKKLTIAKELVINFIIWLITFYLTLRLADPYMFANKNIIIPTINPALINNIKELNSWNNPEVWFPPAIQWINQPITFGLSNLSLYGFGLTSFCLSILGLSLFTKQIYIELSKQNFVILTKIFSLIIIWSILFFIVQSSQFTKTLRYYLPIYFVLSILAGNAINYLLKLTTNITKKWFLANLITLILIIWPLSFLNIYLNKHSRIQASEWIYQNIPTNSKILIEHWDDPLPLSLHEFTYTAKYQLMEIPVFEMDNNQKEKKLKKLFFESDYYIMSSNRGWGSIGRVPEKYPYTSILYKQLLNNEHCFKIIKQFTVSPSLQYLSLPLVFSDINAEEAFTVYDHPSVIILKNQGCPE